MLDTTAQQNLPVLCIHAILFSQFTGRFSASMTAFATDTAVEAQSLAGASSGIRESCRQFTNSEVANEQLQSLVTAKEHISSLLP